MLLYKKLIVYHEFVFPETHEFQERYKQSMCKTSIPKLIFHLESYTLYGEIQKEGKHSVISCKNLH